MEKLDEVMKILEKYETQISKEDFKKIKENIEGACLEIEEDSSCEDCPPPYDWSELD